MSIYPSRLTAKQKQVLQQIQHMIERNGAPPTRAELAKALNFASVNAAEAHVRALERKGMLVLKAGSARGIRLSEQALRMFTSVQTHPNLTVWDTNTDLRQSLLPLNLPLIGRVAAGSPILAQEHVEDTYTVPPTLFLEKPDYLLMVHGISMIDAGIFEGDLLAVRNRKALGDIKDGQIVVARINDEVTVKRLRLRRGRIELHPENPNYRVITVSKADEERFAIEGIVVGLIRQRLQA